MNLKVKRQDFLNKIALMDDEEFEQLVQYFKDGGKQKLIAPDAIQELDIPLPNLHPTPKGITYDPDTGYYNTEYYSDSSKEELQLLEDLLNSQEVSAFMQNNSLVKYKSKSDGRYILIPKEEARKKALSSGGPGMSESEDEIQPVGKLTPTIINGQTMYVDETGNAFIFKNGGELIQLNNSTHINIEQVLQSILSPEDYLKLTIKNYNDLQKL